MEAEHFCTRYIIYRSQSQALRDSGLGVRSFKAFNMGAGEKSLHTVFRKRVRSTAQVYASCIHLNKQWSGSSGPWDVEKWGIITFVGSSTGVPAGFKHSNRSVCQVQILCPGSRRASSRAVVPPISSKFGNQCLKPLFNPSTSSATSNNGPASNVTKKLHSKPI